MTAILRTVRMGQTLGQITLPNADLAAREFRF
jgi:hypothetical protein